MARQPSPFDKINQALAIEPEEVKTLSQLREGYPPRGAPMTIMDRDGFTVLEHVEPGAWRPLHAQRITGLPPACPVTPLGLDGDTAWFLNPTGQVVSLKASSSGKGPIDFLFCGLLEYLEWAWPRFSAGKDGRTGEVSGYHADQARCDLVFAASAMGAFEDSDRIRGRGAWLDEDGGLIYHAGDRILYKGRWRGTGQLGPWVFPSRPKMETPWPAAVDMDGDGPAEQLLDLLRTWRWRRPGIDPRLMLGWNCMAMLGGALKWRSMVFVTGEKGTGKSELHNVLSTLHGKALLSMSDVSAAYLYQKAKFDCTPVELDELEAAAGNDMRKGAQIINVIRRASSGGNIGRGSSEGTTRDYYCRSAFMCGAINIPPLQGQDLSRFAILMLQPFGADAEPPQWDLAQISKVGRQLLRRMMDGFPRWGPTLSAFNAALRAAGHDARAADQFGALIAAEHLARSDDLPTELELADWAALLAPSALMETATKTEDWRDCLMHMLNVMPEVMKHRGRLHSIGEVLRVFKRNGSLEDLYDACRNVGLAVSFPKDKRVPKVWEHAELFIPASHPETRKLFADTTWQGASGAMGVWFTTLQRAPENVVRVGVCSKGLDKKRYGVFVKLAEAFPGGVDEDDEEAAAA